MEIILHMVVLFFIITFFIILILVSRIKIEIREFEVINKQIRKIKIIYSLCAFKIKWLQFTRKKKDFDSYRQTNISKKINRFFIKQLKENYKKIKIEKLIFNMSVGTTNPAITPFIVAGISSIISIVLATKIDKFSDKKYSYQIKTYYLNKNLLELSINCIINIKVVHIISIIFSRKEVYHNDGGASNRRTYDDSNEQYTRYDRRKYNYR